MTVEETATGGTLAWHTAPVRQLVVTLAGTLQFIIRDGEQFRLAPATTRWCRSSQTDNGPPLDPNQWPATTSASSTCTGSFAPGSSEYSRQTTPKSA